MGIDVSDKPDPDKKLEPRFPVLDWKEALGGLLIALTELTMAATKAVHESVKRR